jgi:hypothetical protein
MTRAEVALLVATPLVDPSRGWVMGHSLWNLAPRTTEGKPQVAGIVVLAGPTRPMKDLVIEQRRYLTYRAEAPTMVPRGWRRPRPLRAVRDAGLADGTVVDFLGAVARAPVVYAPAPL